MASLVPVEHDPFAVAPAAPAPAAAAPKLVPVDFDPFATAGPVDLAAQVGRDASGQMLFPSAFIEQPAPTNVVPAMIEDATAFLRPGSQVLPPFLPELTDPASAAMAVELPEPVAPPGWLELIHESAKGGLAKTVGGAIQSIGETFNPYDDVQMSPLVREVLERINPMIAAGRATSDVGEDVYALGEATSAGARAGAINPQSLDAFADAALADPEGTMRFLTATAAESTPGILAALATRNPRAAQALIGTSAYGTSYGSERAAGGSPLEAQRQAVASALLEVVGSKAAIDEVLGGGASLGRRVVRAPALEAAGEFGTGGAQATSDLIGGAGEKNPNAPALEAVIGAIVGGPLGLGEAIGGKGPTDPAAAALADAGPVDAAVIADVLRQLDSSSTATVLQQGGAPARAAPVDTPVPPPADPTRANIGAAAAAPEDDELPAQNPLAAAINAIVSATADPNFAAAPAAAPSEAPAPASAAAGGGSPAAAGVIPEPRLDLGAVVADEREPLDFLRAEIGWAQEGGRLMREQAPGDAENENPLWQRGTGEVTGRTKWIPHADPGGRESTFWRNRPKGITVANAQATLDKYARGEKLSKVEQRFIDYAKETAAEYRADQQAEMEDLAAYDVQTQAEAMRRLREDHAADVADADQQEALALYQLASRAIEAGADEVTVAQASNESDRAYAGRLWKIIRGTDHGHDPRATAEDRAGRREDGRDAEPAAAGPVDLGALADDAPALAEPAPPQRRVDAQPRDAAPVTAPAAASPRTPAPKPATPPTSTKNAVRDAEREARGADPILREAAQTNEETLATAQATVADNPSAGREVVERLKADGPSVISLADEAVLLVEKVRLRNERDAAAARASDENATPSERAAAKAEWTEAEARLNDMDQATAASGREWGRLGQFRQRMLREDFTFEALERRERVRLERPLTADESASLREYAARVQRLEAELQKTQAALDDATNRNDADAAYKALLAEMAKAMSPFKPTPAKLKENAAASLAALRAKAAPVESRRALDTPRERRGDAAEGGTVASVTAAVRAALGPAGAKHVTVLASPADPALPAHLRGSAGVRTEGLYDPATGRVFLFADRVAPHRAGWVAAHEVAGHVGIRGFLDQFAFDSVRERGKVFSDAFDALGANPTVRKLADAIADENPDYRADIALEEALAELAAATRTGDYDTLAARYGITVPQAQRATLRGLVARLVEAIKRLFSRRGDLSDADVYRFLDDAWQHVKRGGGAHANTDPNRPRSSRAAPVFFSAALRAVTEGKGAPKRADPASWKGWLDGAVRRGDMKQAERDWLGIDAWLDGRDAPTTRDELAEFIRANEVKVEDVVLGGKGKRPVVSRGLQHFIEDVHGDDFDFTEANDWALLAEGLDDTANDFEEDGDNKEAAEARDQAGEARRIARDLRGQGEGGKGAPKFGQYTLPGGQNYRELLLTLPTRKTRSQFEEDRLRGLEKLAQVLPGQRGRTALTADEQAELTELRAKAPFNASFTAGHFDQPNVLAHVRFNERTDADGKRVLFIEEIQSDWHQRGRRQGYDDPKNKSMVWTIRDANGEGIGSGNGRTEAEAIASWSRVAGARAQMAVTATRTGEPWEGRTATDRVPDAPFKATDEWAMLAFKRAARWAIDNGFDRVAWTTGAQQNARYNLSKQVEFINVRPGLPGERLVVIRPRGGSGEISFAVTAEGNVRGGNAAADHFAGKPIDEVVGKDMADKIMATTDEHRFEGPELEIGGSGMKGFYDKILPKAVGKWAKPFGATVGQKRLAEQASDNLDAAPPLPRFSPMTAGDLEANAGAENFRDGGWPIKAETRLRVNGVEQKVEIGLDRNGVHVTWYDDDGPQGTMVEWDQMGKGEPRSAEFARFQFAHVWQDEFWAVDRDVEILPPIEVSAPTVHSLEITPKMRDAVSAGQPLFSRAAIDPTTFFHLSRVGAVPVNEGVTDLAAWKARMKADLGDALYAEVESAMPEVFEASKMQAVGRRGADRPIDPENVTHRDVVNLARKHILAGVRGENEVMKAVTADVRAVAPKMTERDVRRLFSEYGKVAFPSKEADKVALRELRTLVQLQESIDRLTAGLPALKSGPQRDKATLAIREKRRALNDLLKVQMKSNAADPEKLATYQQARIANLQHQIEDLTKQIATGERPVRPKPAPPSPEVQALIAERDRLQREKEAIDNPRSTRENEAKKRALRKQIEAVQAKLAGTAKPKPGPVHGPDDADVAALKDQLASLRAQVQALEHPPRSPEERYQATQAKSIARQLADVEARLKANDYARRTRPEPKELNEANKQAKVALMRVKAEFARRQFEDEMAKRHPVRKVFGGIAEAFNLSRAYLTSLDFSALLRQGGFIAYAHPVRAAKAVPQGLRAFASEAEALAAADEIFSRPNAAAYKKFGLELTQDGGISMTKMEEQFMSRWLQRMPRLLGGGLVRGSARAFTTVLNRLRADSFDAMAAALGRSRVLTDAEGKAIANFINVATGRGHIGTRGNAGAQGLNVVFFAPRLVASRFNLLALQPLYGGTARTRAMILAEYARFLMGVSVVFGLAAMAADDDDDPLVTLDPRSSNFLKIRFNNTYIDPMTGLSQVTVFLARMLSGETVSGSGVVRPLRENYRLTDYVPAFGNGVPLDNELAYGSPDAFSVAANFARTKFAPVPGAIATIGTGKTVIGEPVGPGDVVVSMVVPIGFQDVQGVMTDNGLPKGAGIFALSLLGMGVQYRDPTTDKSIERRYNDAEFEMRKVENELLGRVSRLPEDQWDAEFEKLRAQHPEILDGLSILRYADNRENQLNGRAGTARRKEDGTLMLKRDEAAAAKPSQVRQVMDKVDAVDAVIRDLRKGDAITLQQLVELQKEGHYNDVGVLTSITDLDLENRPDLSIPATAAERRAVLTELENMRLEYQRLALEMIEGTTEEGTEP